MRIIAAMTALWVFVCSLHCENGFAQEVAHSTGVKGGVVVVIGCEDPSRIVGLRSGDSRLIHALDTDAGNVARAREHIRSKGLYGPVSVDRFDGERLPFVDNMVNLLVAKDLGDLPMEEVMRVLAPLGVADIGGKRNVKSWPKEIDEWTHWLRDAGGNAVAEDSVVGPPRHLQWIDDPLWLQHHNATIGWSAMVSAKGRIFTIISESPPGVFGVPEQWSLVARDAFNGTLLWRREIEDWGWSSWVGPEKGSRSRFDQPADLQRRLVAVGDHVYAPLGTNAPLSQLDAATGKRLQSYAGTQRVSEVLYLEGKLIVSVHGASPGADQLLDKSILVFDADSGKRLWEKQAIVGTAGKTNELRKFTTLYLAAASDKLLYVDAESVVGLSLATGEEIWRTPRAPAPKKAYGYASVYMPDQCTLAATGDTVLFGQTAGTGKIPWNAPVPATLHAFSMDKGQPLWEFGCGNWSYGSPMDVFAIGDLVWVHSSDDFSMVGIDMRTGKVKRTLAASDALDGPHHHRCYRNKATSNHILTSRRGVEFIDLDSGENLLHHWIRGACLYGILPCNGLLYAPPDPCMCYATAKVNGFVALASKRSATSEKNGDRLERGAAFGKTQGSGDLQLSDAWPTFRHDPARSGSTTAELPAEIEESWRAKIGGALSPVVAADGKVFVASADSHSVHALEEDSGKEIWQYTTGGPIDSPPTFYNGMVLVGSGDGRVYCLRARDGELVWRFQAAPVDLRVVAFGALESPWPVHGSVLVRDGVAYVTAGRSSFLDGGIRVIALEPANGEVLGEGTIFTPDSETGKGVFSSNLRYDMPPEHSGALSDVLVSEGPWVYMRHTKIDPKDVSRDLESEMGEEEIAAFYKQKEGGKVLDYGPQLVSTAGLLDDSWFGQTFWSYANASHSRILVFDEKLTYGVKAFQGGASRHSRSKFTVGTDNYSLFAKDKQSGKGGWSAQTPIRVSALIAAGDSLFAAGTPDETPSGDPWAAYEGRRGGLLWVVSKSDGRRLAEYKLDAPPVWNGMAAAQGRLFLATTDGQVLCYDEMRW